MTAGQEVAGSNSFRTLLWIETPAGLICYMTCSVIKGDGGEVQRLERLNELELAPA